MGQQLVLMGLFFVVPVYLQVVVGLDAFETGKRLLPLSVAMLITAMAGPKIAGRRSPRTVAQAGLVLISAGAVVMLATLDVNLNDTGFKIAMVLVGAGGGLLASQLGNVIMSSTDPSKASETGGLQGTALNLGASLGTALIGAILILNLINGFNDNIADNPQVPAQARETIATNTEEGIDIVPGLPGRATGALEGPLGGPGEGGGSDYGDAQLDALRISIGAVAAIALLCPSGSRGSCRPPPSRPPLSRTAPRRRLPPDPFGPAAGKRSAARTDGSGPKIPARRRVEAAARDCRGSGRAMGAVRREGRERLRTCPGPRAGHLCPRLIDAFHGWTAALTTLVACAGRPSSGWPAPASVRLVVRGAGIACAGGGDARGAGRDRSTT